MSSKQAIQVALRVRPKIPLETDTWGPEKGKEVRYHIIVAFAAVYMLEQPAKIVISYDEPLDV